MAISAGAKYWMIQFESNLDELSYVEKLALVETSFQWRPVANSGVWSVGRGLWYRLEGQFDVSLDIKLSDQDDDIGARLI